MDGYMHTLQFLDGFKTPSMYLVGNYFSVEITGSRNTVGCTAYAQRRPISGWLPLFIVASFKFETAEQGNVNPQQVKFIKWSSCWVSATTVHPLSAGVQCCRRR